MRVLITGSASGFGLGAARLLAERGDTVYATVRNPDTADHLKQLVDAGLPIIVEQLDVRDGGQARSVVKRMIEEGGIDALVNNAGVSTVASVEETSVNQVHDMMEVNFVGAFRLIQLVLPHMRENRKGRIVNVSSGSGSVPLAYLGVYTATKHALDGLSYALAAEVKGFGIGVSVVSPGAFNTPMGTKIWAPGNLTTENEYKRIRQSIIDDMMGRSGGNDPIIVSEAIVSAVHGGQSTFRLLIGDDAVGLDAMRRSSSDDAWLSAMRSFIPKSDES